MTLDLFQTQAELEVFSQQADTIAPMRRTWIIFLLTGLLSYSPPAGAAFEWLPEFESLDETEQAEFEGPSRFMSEYPSDLISYQKPLSWQYLWLERPVAFDTTIGSISSSHFLIEQRARIRAQISKVTEARVTYFQEGDRERDSQHAVIELIFWPLKFLGLSLYGEPETFKRNDDTGIALMLRPSERHEIRVFNTWVDVTRLKRTDRSDNFIEPDLPYARGIVGRLWAAPEDRTGDFLQYSFRHETWTRWLFPDEGYVYSYWRAAAGLLGSVTIGEGLSVQPRVQVDRKFEARDPTAGSTHTNLGHWLTTRLLSDFGVTLAEFFPSKRWDLLGGVAYQSRSWQTDLGEVIYRDFMPRVGLRIPGAGEGDREDAWTFYWQFNWHRAFGPMALRDPQDADARVEHRLNIQYAFRFGERAELILQATADLDEFLSRRIWEGGNGMFRVTF